MNSFRFFSQVIMKYLLITTVLLTALQICIGSPLHIQKRAAFYIANETACVVDHTVYYSGDPIPTDDPCEACKCRPPGFACVLKECQKKPGCRAIRRAGHCCPDYVCGCEHNGRMYRDGDEIRDSQNPCYTCHCQGSSIACAFIDCFFRVDCAPEYTAGECCPHYDNCFQSGESNQTISRDNIPPINRIPKPDVFLTTLKNVKSTLQPWTSTEIIENTDPPAEIVTAEEQPAEIVTVTQQPTQAETNPPEEITSDTDDPVENAIELSAAEVSKQGDVETTAAPQRAEIVTDSIPVPSDVILEASDSDAQEQRSEVQVTDTSVKSTEVTPQAEILKESTTAIAATDRHNVEDATVTEGTSSEIENSVGVLLKSNIDIENEPIDEKDETKSTAEPTSADAAKEQTEEATTKYVISSTTSKGDQKEAPIVQNDDHPTNAPEISTEATKAIEDPTARPLPLVTQQETGSPLAQGKNLKFSDADSTIATSTMTPIEAITMLKQEENEKSSTDFEKESLETEKISTTSAEPTSVTNSELHEKTTIKYTEIETKPSEQEKPVIYSSENKLASSEDFTTAISTDNPTFTTKESITQAERELSTVKKEDIFKYNEKVIETNEDSKESNATMKEITPVPDMPELLETQQPEETRSSQKDVTTEGTPSVTAASFETTLKEADESFKKDIHFSNKITNFRSTVSTTSVTTAPIEVITKDLPTEESTESKDSDTAILTNDEKLRE